MSSRTAARVRRFPLLVGTRAFRRLAQVPSWLLLGSAFTLLLTVSAADLPLPWLEIVARALSIFALLLCVSPVALLAQLDWLVRHVTQAVSARACDVELDHQSVRVIGGTAHGFHASFADLSGEGAVTLSSGSLQIKPQGGKALYLAVPDDADERASLEALVATLRATLLGRDQGAPEAAVASTAERPELLRCTHCGAPLRPSHSPRVGCAFCGTENVLPAELARRLENNELLDARRRADEALCAELLEQPGPIQANALAFIGGALCLALTAVSLFLAAMLVFLADTLGGPPYWAGVSLIEAGLGLLLVSFVHENLARRTALRILTLGFSSRPSRTPGEGDRCRNCGAPLPEAIRERVLTRCVYCSADNLGSLDLGFESDLIRVFSAGELSPRQTLNRLRARRRRARVQELFAVALLGVGVARAAQAPRAIAPDRRTVVLPSLSPVDHGQVTANPGAAAVIEQARLPGYLSALLPSDAEVDVIVEGVDGARVRIHAPHGKLIPDELARATPVPFGSEYATRGPSEPLIVASSSGVYCAGSDGSLRRLYGGTFADTLLEAPEPTGGCSALVTTRAGKYGHFHVRELDGKSSRTLLLNATQPALTADGRSLAVSVLSPKTGVFELALFVPGSKPRLLTHGPMHAGYATWSPDGSRIAFLTSPVQDFIQFSKYTGATQLFVLDLAGHLSQLTTGAEPALVRPVWTQSGIYIAARTGTRSHPETELLRVVPK